VKIGAKLTQDNAKLTKINNETAEVQVNMKLEYLGQLDNPKEKRDEFMKLFSNEN
jgi:hypothetical protein